MDALPLAAGIAGDAEIAAHLGAEAEIAAMLVFERELAAAQAVLGLIPPEAARAIGDATARLRPDMDAVRRGMAQDGVPVPVLVQDLRRGVGDPHAAHVHFGATSQDAVDTGLMLRLKPVFAVLDARQAQVLGQLQDLEAAQGTKPLMAQTRMQAALAITVADKLATWSRPLTQHRSRLADIAASLPLQLGGPVGTGRSFGEPYEALRAEVAARLQLRDAPPWHSDRTVVLEVAQGLSLLTGTLAKMGQDLALMAQNGIDAVRLAGGGGSSAMAHKKNPVAAEVLVALGRLAAGLLGTLAQSMIHENERSGAAWTLEWVVLPQMAQAAGAALRHATALLTGLEFQDRKD